MPQQPSDELEYYHGEVLDHFNAAAIMIYGRPLPLARPLTELPWRSERPPKDFGCRPLRSSTTSGGPRVAAATGRDGLPADQLPFHVVTRTCEKHLKRAEEAIAQCEDEAMKLPPSASYRRAAALMDVVDFSVALVLMAEDMTEDGAADDDGRVVATKAQQLEAKAAARATAGAVGGQRHHWVFRSAERFHVVAQSRHRVWAELVAIPNAAGTAAVFFGAVDDLFAAPGAATMAFVTKRTTAERCHEARELLRRVEEISPAVQKYLDEVNALVATSSSGGGQRTPVHAAQAGPVVVPHVCAAADDMSTRDDGATIPDGSKGAAASPQFSSEHAIAHKPDAGGLQTQDSAAASQSRSRSATREPSSDADVSSSPDHQESSRDADGVLTYEPGMTIHDAAAKLHAFYARFNPAKLPDVDNIVTAFHGRYPQLFNVLNHKYLNIATEYVDPHYTAPLPSSISPLHYRDGLTVAEAVLEVAEFYQQVAPMKVSHAASVVDRHRGDLQALYFMLNSKYLEGFGDPLPLEMSGFDSGRGFQFDAGTMTTASVLAPSAQLDDSTGAAVPSGDDCPTDVGPNLQVTPAPESHPDEPKQGGGCVVQ